MATDLNGTSGSSSTMSSLIGIAGSVKEKWDTSGAGAAVSSVSAQIPQGTKDYFSETSKQMFNREHLRSVTVFFGIGEERPFYVEKAPSLLIERLRHNVQFFYLNYMLLAAVLFVLTLIISPKAIIGIGLLGFAWMYVIRSSQTGSLKIAGLTVSQKQATVAMGGISVVVLLYLLQGVFWWTLFSSGFLVLMHAFFRDASLHKDEEDKMEMQGDLALGEDTAFLGEAQVGTL